MSELAPATPVVIDGRYRVSHLLGEGAFARTLACQDLDDCGRLVALKELRVHGLGEWKPVELFEREARVLASLRHHAVPAIYRHFEGRNAAGQLCLYLVMELIDGRSLRDELAGGRSLDDEALIELTLALLDVLDYLHTRMPPVFHRDIKPSNVVRRGSGAPVLVDFGAVCHGLQPPQGGSTVTGTFGYMPAEQLLGQVSAASDLYALGATLLHLATGREPTAFSFDAGRLSLPPEIAVRPQLRQLIDALLAPAPRDRPQSAAAARRMLLAPEAPRGTAALVAPDRGLRPIRGHAPGGQPDVVDVGPPPRDPKGPLWDVHRNLIHVFHGRRKPGSRGGFWRRFGRGSAAVGLGVVSLGIWPIVAAAVHAQRRAAFEPLFRSGEATIGQLVGLTPPPYGATVASVAYEFEASGQRYRHKMEMAPDLLSHWQVGDPVTVVYDRADPTHSCLLYRWQ